MCVSYPTLHTEKHRDTKNEGRYRSSFCGQRWIRTTEVERQQIYSLPHLATLEFAQTPTFAFAVQRYNYFFNKKTELVKKTQAAPPFSLFLVEASS